MKASDNETAGALRTKAEIARKTSIDVLWIVAELSPTGDTKRNQGIRAARQELRERYAAMVEALETLELVGRTDYCLAYCGPQDLNPEQREGMRMASATASLKARAVLQRAKGEAA